MSTATLTGVADAAAYPVCQCWRCGGPCATFKGSVHGWTCTPCLDRYLAYAAARADVRDRAERAARQAKFTADKPART
ncbi:MAG: hypothetical protein K0U84_03455 [Actinomycetia bacterium]|nr:hypothetical protein [Actinomycetes bacterium]